MSDEVKELLQKVLEGQEKILKEIETDRKKIEEINQRIAHIEAQPKTGDAAVAVDLSPALIKALKAMFELECPCSTQELAKHLDLSRNVVSLYLNQLERIGLVNKKPNLGTKRARYLFEINFERMPDNLRAFIPRKIQKMPIQSA